MTPEETSELRGHAIAELETITMLIHDVAPAVEILLADRSYGLSVEDFVDIIEKIEATRESQTRLRS